MTTRHTHRPRPSLTRTVGYTACVAHNGTCHPAAHGGVTRYEICRCGAIRRTNSTGFGREERGTWSGEDDE